MALPPISTTLGLSQSVAQSRDTLFDLQRQLATGKKTTSYGGLGADRTTVLSLRGEVNQVQGYLNGIGQASLRTDVMLQSLTRMGELAATTRTDGLEIGYDLLSDGQTVYQKNAAAGFDEMAMLLNGKVGDRYVFGGRQTEHAPVVPAKHILDGVDGKAGFQQVVDERRQADLGADGLGRLVLDTANDTVTVAEDVPGSPFGFKLAAVNSNLRGVNVAGPAGSPAEIEVEFSAALPRHGETFRLTLDLPDGTRTEVTLTATEGPDVKPGEFLIGADADETAANFNAAMSDSLELEAKTSLSAASAFAAAGNFFDFDADNPPQRVDGPPFDTATGLRDATDADTVIWYRGELSDMPARDSAVAKVDDAISAAYGARANEDAFVTTLKHMAVASVERFDKTEPADAKRYAQMRQRSVDALGFPGGAQKIESIATEITLAKTTMGKAEQRHKASTNMLKTAVDDIENADIYQVSAQILALQTRIEASLHATVALNRLSLTNFI